MSMCSFVCYIATFPGLLWNHVVLEYHPPKSRLNIDPNSPPPQRVSLAMSLLNSQGVAGERLGQANCKQVLESLPVVLAIHQTDK